MSAIRFTETAAGVTFPVKVQPRARRNAVVGAVGEALKLQVTAPPEDGRANEAVVELLAGTLGVKRRQVEIVAGATSREKVVRVRGVSCGELATRLLP